MPPRCLTVQFSLRRSEGNTKGIIEENRRRRKEEMHDSENGSKYFVHNEDETTRERTEMMECEI